MDSVPIHRMILWAKIEVYRRLHLFLSQAMSKKCPCNLMLSNVWILSCLSMIRFSLWMHLPLRSFFF